MATALLGIGLVALFFILMSVRLIFVKDGKFRGTCASQSPFLKNEDGSCGYCGRKADGTGECAKEGSMVKEVLSGF